MQKCPKCGRTFENDTQKFCTHDGGRLEPDAPLTSSQAPTKYDLNSQTISTDPFDPEATVTRLPDLNKTVAAMPTSEIRSKETGPATPPPAAQPPQPQPPPQEARESQPTVAFTQPPPPPQAPPQAPPQYYQPQPGGPPPPPAMQPPPPPAQQMQPPPQQYGPGPGSQPQMPPQQMPPQQHQHPKAQAAAAGRKSSKMPLIIGLVVLVLVGGAAAWYFLVYKKGKAESNANTSVANTNANANTSANANENSNTTANANVNTTPTPAPQPPPPNSTEFVNSKDNLDGKLAEKYEDFSFYYPNGWERDPKSGVPGASNFIRVERRLPPDLTQENFTVSWYDSKGTFETDSEGLFQQAVDLQKAKLSKSYPEFKVVSDEETTINGIKGYEFRFQGLARGTANGDVTFWGRVVFLPPGKEGETHGLQLLMLTTSLAPELKSAEDVGVKGELPMILNSFKIGKN